MLLPEKLRMSPGAPASAALILVFVSTGFLLTGETLELLTVAQ